MGKVYYNAPISLFKDFLTFANLPDGIIAYAMAVEFQKNMKKYNDEHTSIKATVENLVSSCGHLEQFLSWYDPIELVNKGLKLVKEQSLLTPREPNFSLDADLYWCTSIEKKTTKQQRLLILAYMALKSICGKNRDYCKTNDGMWVARIACKPRKGGKIPASIESMMKTPYQRRKIRNLLYEYYKVSFYANHVSGFYFSTSLNLEELIKKVEFERRGKNSNSLQRDTQKILKGLGLCFLPLFYHFFITSLTLKWFTTFLPLFY